MDLCCLGVIPSLNDAEVCSAAYPYLKQEKQHASDLVPVCVCLTYSM